MVVESQPHMGIISETVGSKKEVVRGGRREKGNAQEAYFQWWKWQQYKGMKGILTTHHIEHGGNYLLG